MPILSKKCIRESVVGTVYGGGANEDRVIQECKNLLTDMPRPDMFGARVRNRFVDGVPLTSWSVKGAIH